MDMKSNLLIIDGDFLLYTATMGKKVFDENKEAVKEDGKFVYIPRTKEEVFECSDQIINTLFAKTNAEYYIASIGNCKSFRYDIYPEYKGNRTNRVRPDYFKELKEYLIEGWNFQPTECGLEADDVVNIIKNNLQNDYNCITATSDKDLIKSIAGTYINVKNLEIIETSQKEADLFFWRSMIIGDTADNIKGLPGRGEKYADKILALPDELNTGFAMEILNQYIAHYKCVDIGIEEFYKTYKCLKILDSHDTFTIPDINIINKEVIKW